MTDMRSTKAISLWLVLLFSFIQHASSQEMYIVKQALAARTGYNYGREAVYTDKLAYLLFNGQLGQPSEGERIALPGTDSVISWQTVIADSANNIALRASRRDFLRGGG